MKLVLASQNEKKLKEMNDILSQLGIEVCLQSQLGVHVDVEETGDTFEENSRLKAQALLENMRGQSPRTARFVSVITCCFPNGDVITARGECPGTIAYAPQGQGGFGYDPVFFLPQRKKTFAQLTAEEKNEISHRGRALALFQEKLKEYLNK